MPSDEPEQPAARGGEPPRADGDAAARGGEPPRADGDAAARGGEPPRADGDAAARGRGPLRGSLASQPHDEELEEVLDRYMEELAEGRKPNQEEYLRAYPHLADALRGIFKTLEFVETAGKSLNASKLEAGQMLGEFRILREIGRGGMGVVYEAVQTSLGRRVALKVLPANVVLSENALERFDREAHTAGKLHHTNIVPVYAVGEGCGISYYAMQFIRGRSLAHFLKTVRESGVKPQRDHFRRVARWGQQIADALAYAHDQGVIHRDIKPANILLDAKDNIWVFDFGLARTEDSPTITQSGDLVGTARYMSPEQISSGSSYLDNRTDIYSLGATLYELAAFSPAYDGESHAVVLQQVSRHDPPPLRQTAVGIPRDLETIIGKCMHRDAGLRYQRAADVAEDLRRFLAGEPIMAKRDSTWYLVQRTVRRYKLPFAAAAAFVLVVLVSAVTLGVMYGQQRRLREQAEEQTRAIRSERDRAARQAEIARVERERAEQQSRIAESERDRAVAAEGVAKQRFDQVRELANTVIFDIHDKIAVLPGSTPARQFLIAEALKYLDSLAEESGSDRSLLRDLAAAYVRIGDVQGNPGSSHLGDTAGAMRSYGKAMEVCRAWIEAEPDNSETRKALGMCHERTGDILATTGRTEEAMQSYQRCLELYREFAESKPGEPAARRGIAIGLNKIGNTYNTLGQRDKALRSYEESLGVLEGIAAADPENDRYRQDLCVTHTKVGLWLHEHERPEEALVHFRKSLEMSQAMLAKDPNNARFIRHVSIGHDMMGNALSALKEVEPALEHYRKGLKMSEMLAAADPNDVQARRDLEVSHNNIGRMEREAGRYEAALESHAKALKIAEELSEGDSANSVFKSDVAYCLRMSGETLTKAGRREEASGSYRRAVEVSREIVDADASNASARADLHKSYAALGALCREIGEDAGMPISERIEQYQAARSWLAQARAILVEMKDLGQLPDEETASVDSISADIGACDAKIDELRVMRQAGAAPTATQSVFGQDDRRNPSSTQPSPRR